MRKTFAVAAAALTFFGGVGTAAAVNTSEDSETNPSGVGSERNGLFTSVTGKLVRSESGYSITGESSGDRYLLSSESGIVRPYVGKRVKVTGSTPGGPGGGADRLAVRTVEPVARGEQTPERGTTELRFRVSTDGNVPDGMTFYGLFGKPGPDPHGEVAGIEELGAIALNDFDGDGVYTAPLGMKRDSRVVARVAVGSTATGPREVIHPQSIVQRDNTVVLDEDTTVSTDYRAVRPCGDVSFTPDSDHGAFGIRATGVDCGIARQVAADAEGDLGDNYRSHEFTCLADESDSELGGYDYTCRHGVRKVTFAAS
ncbi:hypothetical protein [Actinopolyspora halophila]|uniref:hypothetical protein n=1 Tax=Actinopolyspora halophila TaxID=1850 RepID=UPI00037B8DE4|nr:hypothetical protein [Actinopolyspora halophila]